MFVAVDDLNVFSLKTSQEIQPVYAKWERMCYEVI